MSFLSSFFASILYRLIDIALGRVAAEMDTDLASVKQLPQGNARRNRHDDITVVVLFFQEETQGKDCDSNVVEAEPAAVIIEKEEEPTTNADEL